MSFYVCSRINGIHCNLIPLTITLMEIQSGTLGPEKLKDIREQGWSDPPIITRLMLDAKSVFESVKAQVFKPPAENSLAGHVLWLREMLLKKLVGYVTWTDTRDMLADGLTKGSVSRDSLEDAMNGTVRILNTVEQCHKTKGQINM